MTLREIEEALEENEKKLPWHIDVESIEMHATGNGSEEVNAFFAGCHDLAVCEHIRLIRLREEAELRQYGVRGIPVLPGHAATA